MNPPETIRVFNSQGEDYKRAFQVFLDHTDQKRNAKQFLRRIVEELSPRRVFIDAGAGNGEVTRAFSGAFGRTIAIEPNAHLLSQLARTIPSAETISHTIMGAAPPTQGDLVLASHIFYYIPPDQWLAHLERLVTWMSATGVTVVVLQNRGTGCMAMLEHFMGHRFDLHGLADAFRAKHGDRYDITMTLDPAHVDTGDRASAYTVAEFMLNLLPLDRGPTRRDVEDYLETHFAQPDGRYRVSVDQDFLQVRCRANPVSCE